MSQEVSEPCTDWTPSRSRDCLDPQKSLISLECLEHSSESRIRQSRDSPLQPKTQPVRAHLMCNNSTVVSDMANVSPVGSCNRRGS